MEQNRNNPEFEAFLEEVRRKLPEYLQRHGVSIDDKGWFRCINPTHEDKNPSSHFVQADDLTHPTRFKCFGCGAAGDIFTAATFFERKPTEGKGWLVDNVYYLAELFEVPHEKIELTEEDLLLLKQQRLYTDAAAALDELCEQNPAYYANAEARGIWRSTCKAFGIGSVPFPVLLADLEARGWEEHFVRSAGIDETHFHERFLTFTLKNMHGSVMGFDRRYMDWDREKEKAFRNAGKRYPPKYQATSQKRCRLIQKEVLLLNIHWARERPLCRLDVFEGFTDFYTAVQAGHRCCTAVCGSHLTEYMVHVMRQCGFSHVNLIYDSDQVGLSKMAEAVEKFRNQEGLAVTIMPLNFVEDVPDSDRDVDFYLRAWPSLDEGLRNFMGHKPISAFEWMLDRRLKEGAAGKSLADQMVGLIVNESNLMDRGVLCKQLAEKVGIPEHDIRAEVERIANRTIDEITIRTALRVKQAQNTALRVKALRDGLAQIEAYKTATTDTSMNPLESVEFVRQTVRDFYSKERGIVGWKSGWKCIDILLRGIPKAQAFIVMGGAPNTGKTALLHNINVNILLHNEEPAICYLSLDDSRRSTTARLLAVMTGLPINWCDQPQERIFGDESFTAQYRDACDRLISWSEEGRFVLKGAEVAGSTAQIEDTIKAVQDRLGRPVVVMVDSFHNVEGLGVEDRLHYKALSKWCRRTTDLLQFTLLCTAEGTKEIMKKPRPHYHDLGETGAICYDAHLIGIVHNDVHFTQGNTRITWSDQGTPRPILEVSIQKNKIENFKSPPPWYFKFRDYTGQLFEMSPEEVRPLFERRTPTSGAQSPGPQDIMGAPQ